MFVFCAQDFENGEKQCLLVRVQHLQIWPLSRAIKCHHSPQIQKKSGVKSLSGSILRRARLQFMRLAMWKRNWAASSHPPFHPNRRSAGTLNHTVFVRVNGVHCLSAADGPASVQAGGNPYKLCRGMGTARANPVMGRASSQTGTTATGLTPWTRGGSHPVETIMTGRKSLPPGGSNGCPPPPSPSPHSHPLHSFSQ